jgi:precorrin-2/cobalt-factor-2 C20-methyltransferase
VSALLSGVGVGPGDPELLTLLGLRTLREAELIVVPVRDDRDEVGYAERVVSFHLPDAPMVRAPFALADRGGVSQRRVRAWDAAASLIVDAFGQGRQRIAFATIGDPNVYSTFGYLAATVRERRPATSIETVPGITAMQALAAASGTVLCEGSEPLVLFPAAGQVAALGELLDQPALAGASVVGYKGGRHWPALRELLADRGRLGAAVVGTHLGRDDQLVRAAEAIEAELPYLSTVISPPSRTTRGGKLL